MLHWRRSGYKYPCHTSWLPAHLLVPVAASGSGSEVWCNEWCSETGRGKLRLGTPVNHEDVVFYVAGPPKFCGRDGTSSTVSERIHGETSTLFINL